MINFACVKDKRRKKMSRYESAREIYASLGVDTEKAIETLRSTAVSVHCWQGDDVTGSTRSRLSPAEYRPPATTPARRAHPKS